MNQLIWKEWREQRTTLAAAPLIFCLLLLIYSFVERHGLYGARPNVSLDSGNTIGFMYAAWLLSAALCGATMMAPEVGSGTLRLLSMLPISRARIWGVKLFASAMMLICCIAASTLAYVAFCLVLRWFGMFDTPPLQLFSDSDSIGPVAVLCLLVFATGCYATMLLDRAISAVTATALGSVAVSTFLITLGSWLHSDINPLGDSDSWIFVLWIVFAFLMLGLSYRTFQIGETLKTSKRFAALLPPRWFSNIVLIGLTLLVAYYWIVS